MTVNNAVLVILTPLQGGGLTIPFSLEGDAVYNQASGGQGGWQIVDRPRLVAATQWYDRSPMQLALKLIMESEVINGVPGQSIEQQIQQLDGWLDKVPGTNQPPVFRISGPISGANRFWLIFNFTFNEAIRDSRAGFRTQQKLDLTLYEYNSPLQQTLNLPGPAAQAGFLAAQNANGAASYYAYIVKAGDTLESIAANLIGNYAAWPFIAAANNLRDPNNIFPGQVLSIPQ